MYQEFYGLTEKPFSLTPNPQFLFYSRQYREAEDQLLYGINNREGFMLVTGQPGTGKTTLCRDLIEKLDRRKYQSALIFNPFLNGEEMLAALLTEFGVTAPQGANRKELLDRLNAFLLAQLAMGRSCVAIFDEAQHLSTEFLEQIRVLSNLETHQEKLIQIILVGQPELLENILSPRMAQLDQRVSIRCTLSDLDLQETDRYIHHRLNVAGAKGEIRFNNKAVDEIFRASGGVPRRVNLLCDRALLAAYTEQMRDVSVAHVRKAVQALRGDDLAEPPALRRRSSWTRWAAVAAGVVVVGGLTAAVAFWPGRAEAGDEALYWSAKMASSPASAEQSLVELVRKYPASVRMDDALLQLARLQMSRGDRAAALATLGQLNQREPAGPWHNRASVLSGLVQLDAADTVAACTSLRGALADSLPAEPLLATQGSELISLCAARAARDSAAAAGAAPDSSAMAGAAPSAPPDSTLQRRDSTQRGAQRADSGHA
jgi:type II secretory pathway predicted ATPase ExeA